MRDSLNEREQEILKRLSNGLSDQQIADELYLSLNTVKWYNRQIYSKLGVRNRIQAIASAKDLGLLEKPVSPLSPPAPKHNLPAQTNPFIGRSREIAEVKQLLNVSRLLTLTGVGGTGKTRLALQVAIEVVEDFTDGVCFVDLAPLTDHTLVANAIAAAQGVVENSSEPLLETLKRALTTRELLLLIDNFEHVIVAALLVSDLLAACPRLKVLITSRESLRLTGEQEYPVPPLSLPIADAISVQNLTESEAGALFVQRAQMTRPHFAVSNDSAPAIAQICSRLDGLPLAIELAAARCKLLTPQALLERLDSRLDALAGGSRNAPARQQSLRNTIEWSYNLLDQGENTLFARLAVFYGGCSLEAIETICGVDLPIDVIDGLASLVDKSLVQQKETTGRQPRFLLLEMIREYAWEQLKASGEAETMRRRHAEYFVERAERAEPELHRGNQLFWLDRLDEEHDNLRAALEWSLTNGEAELALRLVGALGWFWHMRSHAVEGYRWALRALELEADVAPAVRAKALHITGNRLLLNSGDCTTKRKFHEEALQIARENNDRYSLSWALIGLALVALEDRDHRETERLAKDALIVFRDLDDKTGIGWALCCLGEAHRLHGNPQEAEPFYQEGLELFEAMGNRRGATMMLSNLGFVAFHQRHLQRARALFRKSYGLNLLVGRQEEYANTLTGIAGIIAAQDEPERAVRLLAAANSVLEAIGATTLFVAEQVDYKQILDTVRAQLDDATFEAAWAEGRAMTLEQAVLQALDESEIGAHE
jgi:predicted ATPase/DNA-binding CsgD family transcriptional regulator